MMQTAEARAGDYCRLGTRLFLYWPAPRGVFVERVVNAVLLKVGNVFPDQPTQVPFVERDHVIEQLASTTSHPALGDAILPGRCDARSLGFQTRRLEEVDDAGIELCVTIQDDVAVGIRFGKRFA